MSYNQLEEPLQLIHKRFVSLDPDEVNETKPLLRRILLKLVNYMKEEDSIFQKYFHGLYFGGSFYHNLKIQVPDEFDIDFLFLLPICNTCKIRNCGCVKITPSEVPGFLYFKMKKASCVPIHKQFCRNGYVQSNLVFNWMKSLIYKALYRFGKDKQSSEEDIFIDTEVNVYTECAPALKIHIKNKSRSMYIDLAAAFKLDQIHWPDVRSGYKTNPTNAEYFSIVPFSPRGSNNYWRPSFQEQEKEIISKKERMKPALRLLKMMKTNLKHRVSSYILKTLILEEADHYEWKNISLAQTFMIFLEKYIECLRVRRVRYYWNDNVNLLDYIKEETLVNHCNEMSKLHLKIQREYEANPTIVAEIILKRSSDYKKFNEDWNAFKKHPNQVSNRETTMDEDDLSGKNHRVGTLQNIAIDIFENSLAFRKSMALI